MLFKLSAVLRFYTDSVQCADSIKDEQILHIVSDFSRIVFPQIRHLRSIVAIFIFCVNRQYHVSLVKEHVNSTRQTMNLLEKRTLTFSLFTIKNRKKQYEIRPKNLHHFYVIECFSMFSNKCLKNLTIKIRYHWMIFRRIIFSQIVKQSTLDRVSIRTWMITSEGTLEMSYLLC
jgi:hypothetical protein